jgi:hypothetical protein
LLVEAEGRAKGLGSLVDGVGEDDGPRELEQVAAGGMVEEGSHVMEDEAVGRSGQVGCNTRDGGRQPVLGEVLERPERP